MARDLGIRRVILPRELPLERIRALHGAFPEMELEAFIHGALCYSFSGICLASWSLAGRSSNRGDCAQICRSRFEEQPDAGAVAGGDAACGHLFSCRDLFLGRNVLGLGEAGVCALKIEGRMKSPEYVFNVTKMYRAILDRGAALGEDEYAELERRVALSFSRQPTTGWLQSSSGSRLIDTGFPGHRGTVLGTVSALEGRDIRLRVSADVSLHDGVGYFAPGTMAPTIFSVSRMHRGGNEVRFARAGDTVTIEVPAAVPGSRAAVLGSREEIDVAPPVVGTEIRHMSSRFLDLPQPKEAGFPFFRIPAAIEVSLDGTGSLSFSTGVGGSFAAPVTVERAQRKRPFAPILTALLGEPGSSLFVPSRVSFQNRSSLADDEIFVPPSQLKKAKNDFYTSLDKAFLSGTKARTDPDRAQPAVAESLGDDVLAKLADRDRLSPPSCAPVPFADADPARLEIAGLARFAGYVWLPLPPVILEERAWVETLRSVAAGARQEGLLLAVGLNNVGHVALARSAAGPGIRFFVDIFLYAANTRTTALLLEHVAGLLFAYSWIEAGGDDARPLPAGPVPMVEVSGDFRPPLFYSMGCFARHVLNKGKCFEDCPKDFTRSLRQGRNTFQVIVRDCVTWLFKAAP